MEEYSYIITSIEPQSITQVDTISIADDNLISEFDINSSFNPSTDYVELHYYTLDGRLISSIPFYTGYQTNQDSEIVNGDTLNTLQLRVEEDILKGGFEQGDVNIIYNFLSDPYSDNYNKETFFIEEISSDRLEIRLLSTTLSDSELQTLTAEAKLKLNDPSVGNLRVNLGSNILLLGLNLDTLPYENKTSVVVKLYSPLPAEIDLKGTLSLAFEVANPAAYNITAELVQVPQEIKYLKGPNINLEGGVNTSFPTEYLSIEEAYGYQVTGSYYQVKSLFEEKGAELSIDHSDYSNFINFSSAEERLKNFQYKLNLISTYQNELNIKTVYTGSTQAYTGSRDYYEGLINSILSNFDHYDRYLYYESSSFSWPKSNSTKPYTLTTGSATGSWYTEQVASASLFDDTNPNLLLNTVPAFIKDDPSNEQYNIFVHMVAQHFDNIWLYAKGLSDKYDADNRLNFGISKDLVQDALRNFGIKLYNSNKTTQELFEMFTGDFYNESSEDFGVRLDSGSINFISGSNISISEEDYRKQVYKRLYHNLPLLLESKGTERGLRALLSSFGIPSLTSEYTGSSLLLTQFGGTLTSGSNLGGLSSLTSSLDKIRLDNTGSTVGNTLSQYTSIIKRNEKYSQDSNLLEAGFSPTTYINELILESGTLDNFNIDQIVGDPGYAFSSSYEGLEAQAAQALSGSITERYDLKDFTRLLKFYDNVIFKTIKDFLPGRNDISTGIIIKPHILERSKIPQVKNTTERHNEFSQSIEINSISGSTGDSFGGQNQYTSSYINYISVAVSGSSSFAPVESNNHEEPKYNGELSGSYLRLTAGELNDENIYKYDRTIPITFAYNFIDADLDCDVIWGTWSIIPSPTPTPSITPTKSIPATPSSTPASTPEPTPDPTPDPSPTSGASPTPSPTPTPTTPCETMSNVGVGFTSLGEDENDACSQVILNQFGSDSTDLSTATVLYSSTTCESLASPGHYAQGGSWRYWNGTAFTDSGTCPIPPSPSQDPTPTPSPVPDPSPDPTPDPTPDPSSTPAATVSPTPSAVTPVNSPTPSTTSFPTPTLIIDSDCAGGLGTGYINLSATGGSGNYTFHISNATAPPPYNGNTSLTNLSNGTYFVGVLDNTYGTSDFDTVVISCVAPSPTSTPAPTITPSPTPLSGTTYSFNCPSGATGGTCNYNFTKIDGGSCSGFTTAGTTTNFCVKNGTTPQSFGDGTWTSLGSVCIDNSC